MPDTQNSYRDNRSTLTRPHPPLLCMVRARAPPWYLSFLSAEAAAQMIRAPIIIWDYPKNLVMLEKKKQGEKRRVRCVRPCVLSHKVVSSHSLQPHGLKPTRLLCPWNSPGKNTGVGSHFLLQGIFPTQGLKPHLFCLLHCRQILDRLSHQESPWAIPTLPGLRFFICSSTYLVCLIGLM